MDTEAINLSNEKKNATNNSENEAVDDKQKNKTPSGPQISDTTNKKVKQLRCKQNQPQQGMTCRGRTKYFRKQCMREKKEKYKSKATPNLRPAI